MAHGPRVPRRFAAAAVLALACAGPPREDAAPPAPPPPAPIELARALPPTAPLEEVVRLYHAAEPISGEDERRLLGALCDLAASSEARLAVRYLEQAAPHGGCSEEVRSTVLLAVSNSVKSSLAEASRDSSPTSRIETYDAARGLIDEAGTVGLTSTTLAAQRRSLEAARVKSVCAEGAEMRGGTVRTMLQDQFYAAGLDVTVRVYGKCGENVDLDYILWSGPAIYQFENGPILAVLRDRGFKKVRAKGYDRTWSWDL